MNTPYASLCAAFNNVKLPQDGERGVLLFTASMTVVRNGRVREVPFDTQTETLKNPSERRGVTLPTVDTRETGGRKVFCMFGVTGVSHGGLFV